MFSVEGHQVWWGLGLIDASGATDPGSRQAYLGQRDQENLAGEHEGDASDQG